jgi:hypothetical protein
VVVADLSSVDSISPKTFSVNCPAGSVAIGGNVSLYKGLFDYYDSDSVKITYASPSLSGSSFVGRAVETTATNDNWGLFVSGICKYPD